jgi:LmbE family N-acetylglucosaminyl deacetylase
MMGVWAHPDDEAFLTGGLMAEAVRNGRRVVLLTATKGELGIQDPDRWPPEKLPEIREGELKASLAFLGVEEHHWLGYPDGGCPQVPREEAVAKIAAFIDSVQPQHVFTFGPEGMTGHSDHKAVSSWTLEAFERAAPAGARLYYATMTPAWCDEYLERLTELGAFYQGAEPPITAEADLAISYEVPPDLLQLKWQALLAQASQTEGLIKLLGETVARDINATEYFRLATAK